MPSETNSRRALLAIGMVLAAIPGALAILVVPRFEEVFRSFGAELPGITELALRYPAALLTAPALVVLCWFAWPKPTERGSAALVAGLACLVVVPVLLAGIMYLPIAKLATPV